MIVIKRPIITEKSMKLADKYLYTFEVDRNATKAAIAKAVGDRFNVKVLKVKTINVKGERKMQRRARKFYQTASVKKAMVQVVKGAKIAIFETPKKEEVEVAGAEGEPVVVKEKKDILRRTKIKVEKGVIPTDVGTPTTQRKVIPT